jgi:hypothetical protein
MQAPIRIASTSRATRAGRVRGAQKAAVRSSWLPVRELFARRVDVDSLPAIRARETAATSVSSVATASDGDRRSESLARRPLGARVSLSRSRAAGARNSRDGFRRSCGSVAKATISISASTRRAETLPTRRG